MQELANITTFQTSSAIEVEGITLHEFYFLFFIASFKDGCYILKYSTKFQILDPILLRFESNFS